MVSKRGIGTLIIFLLLCPSVLAVLECTVRQNSCSGGESEVMAMSATSDAHAELANASDYTSLVCCKDSTAFASINASCMTGSTTFLRLSGTTDAHVENSTLNSVDYPYNACINSNNADFTCSYKGSCAGNEACLATISDSTDAHVADCTTDPYSIKVCCEMAYRDTTPPAAVSIVDVDGDPSSPYWDNSNNSQTIVQTNRPEAGMLCRWGTSDVAYSSMSSGNECTVGVSSISCNMTNLAQASSYTRYISCKDATGNEQNTTQNKDLAFGVDFTNPVTYMSGYGSYYLPGHNVTVFEDDNLGTPATILTWHCEPSSGCTPTTLIENGSTITFSARGTNYLRWYSRDEAENNQSIQQVTVEINSLPNVTLSSMQYGIGGAPYTGKHGQRVYFYCDGTDANGAVDGNDGYSAKIWLRYRGQSGWRVTGTTMAWSAIDGRWQYDHLLDDALDIYNATYDMVCEITDDLGESSNRTKNSTFTIINTPPYGDDILVNDSNAKKYQTVRFYCSGADADTPLHQENTLSTKFWLRTQGAGTWNRMSNVSMAWDAGASNHYVDYTVIDDGTTHYDAQCQLYDGVDWSTLYQEFQTEYTVADDWDNDGVPDATDTLGGSGTTLNTTQTISVLVDNQANNSPAGTRTVDFKDTSDNTVLVRFNYNFSTAPIDTHLIFIKRASHEGRSSVIVNGLTGVSKNITVPKGMGSGRVCVKNATLNDPSEISAGCDGADEFLIECDNTPVSGMRCRDDGTAYLVSGLTHSGVIESGNARLEEWYAGYQRIGPTVNFYANYSNSTSKAPIPDGNCTIWFADNGWQNMTFNTPLWSYGRTFGGSGNYDFNVSCSSPTYDELSLQDTITIDNIEMVPEFGTVALLVALAATVAGMIAMRGKRR